MADDLVQSVDKTGVIYLSKIPTYMSVLQLREFFSRFGDIGRIFLQPNENAPVSKRGRLFTEGWVEFKNKKEARSTAEHLNNTTIDAKKKQPWYGEMWNMKYLPKFKWTHLSERLAVESASFRERLRTEISAVKRQVDFHRRNAEKSRVQREIAARKHKRGEGEGSQEEAETPGRVQEGSEAPPKKKKWDRGGREFREGKGYNRGVVLDERMKKILDGPKPDSVAKQKTTLSQFFVGKGQTR